MDESSFGIAKQAVDAALDQLGDEEVGIKLGWVLYSEFRRRDLLKPRPADMLLWQWVVPSYRGRYVVDSYDPPDRSFEVLRPLRAGTDPSRAGGSEG